MTQISIGWFLLGYLILWVVELARLWVRPASIRIVLAVLATAVLASHAIYVWGRIASHGGGQWAVPATFFDWGVIAALALGVAYWVLNLRSKQGLFGVFLLPLIIGMAVAGLLVPTNQPFERGGETRIFWSYVHGGALAAAAATASLGLAVALLRLWQQRRLKSKRGLGGPLRLPSLEYLDGLGRSCLIASTAAIATGLVGGVVMNASGSRAIPWLQPGLVLSGGLLIWMTIALVLEFRASRGGGTRTVLLNVISFVGLALAFLAVALNGQSHRQHPAPATSAVSLDPSAFAARRPRA